jgi:hypothetical protein
LETEEDEEDDKKNQNNYWEVRIKERGFYNLSNLLILI